MTIGEQTYGWKEGDKVIHITKEAWQSIVSQAQKDAPIESCGYALGVETPSPSGFLSPDNGGTEGGVKTIEGRGGALLITYNYPLTNIDHAAEHFSLDPKEQFAAIKYARQNGLKVIGNWHSHPASPSRPSEEDKRLAFDPKALYLILSLSPDVSGLPYAADGAPVLNAFRIEDGEVTRFPVIV